MKEKIQKLQGFMVSNIFFYLILGIFLFSATWIALSGRYPMAFDENYHYGIIQQYAKQLSPFFHHPPAYSEALGDITRYPSYLFHYLMSFPYRLISVFAETDAIKIIILRFINIALLASSLFIFRRLFQKLRISPALSHLALLCFVLIPVVPFLGAQINYDNLLIPLVGLVILLAVIIIERLKTGVLDVSLSASLIIICLLASLVKYTFLPIFLALALGCLYTLLCERKRHHLKIWEQIASGFARLSMVTRLLLVAGMLVGIGLFGERYGVNVVKYHTPVPDCNQVLSVKSCLQYGPWGRDYALVQAKTGPPSWNAVRYTRQWVSQSMQELFFAINQDYVVQSPLPVIYWFSWAVGMSGVALTVLFWKRLRQMPHSGLMILTILIYSSVLWVNNYQRFTTVNWPVAIHGRYLLPILPLIFVIIGEGFKAAAEKFSRASNILQPVLTAGAILIMLQGGLVTYLVRSSDDWYWRRPLVVQMNAGVRHVLTYMIPH